MPLDRPRSLYGFREFHYLSISRNDYTPMGKRFDPEGFRAPSQQQPTASVCVTRKSSSSNSDIRAQVGNVCVRRS